MRPCTLPQSQLGDAGPAPDRRRSPREPAVGNLWLIDNHTSTILRGRCVDVSQHGIRMRVPVGYGVQPGQQYELCSHLPGQSAPPGLGLSISRRASVVWTRVLTDHEEGDIEIGLELAPRRLAQVSTPLAAASRNAAPA